MMKRLEKWQVAGTAFLATALFTGTALASSAPAPKYVFYFIGDGMAAPQVQATEAYLAAGKADDATPGSAKLQLLNFSKFSAAGMQTSYANDRLITDSAAAGTALSAGMKTNCGVIAMDADATRPYTTLAEAAKKKGMMVGILSSVSIDHATPATFYAHNKTRNNYEAIGENLLDSGFDYYGGGGFRVNKYKSSAYKELKNDQRYELLEQKATQKGWTYVNTRKEFDGLKSTPAIAVNPYLDSSNAMPYALNTKNSDTYKGSITLAEFTQKGIDLMSGNSHGFFMMVEGGKIDWAAHANDARAAIDDTIAFDEAVGVAVKFAKAHPQETLIVVTGDHECGGMTIGFAGTAYGTYFEKLNNQKIAYDDFDNTITKPFMKVYEGKIPSNINGDMWKSIFVNFGLDGSNLTAEEADDLTAYEKQLLENAYDKTMLESKSRNDEESIIYGSYNPLSVTLTHIIDRKSGLAWTSYSHTAVPVPVFADGIAADTFNGYYDNTDVAKKLAMIMDVKIGD
ncbi:alkaline phosphatase [Desulfobulbus rhabdoformis]|uniref:alkaline phosphatase n=1 Tax=Desulfobulbus rhabdoformis TaxID=34032 RepID=UPI0019661870|nr:alkaline phosphatase [Desulfobulbus rhabdoformis]MBM9616475.1 alkaline phosphatase [Desulfobulbus rhabdoformis]